MKRKFIGMAVSFLLCLGMVGMGFAAWVIAAPTTVEASGTISVEDVTDARLNITTAWKDSKSAIIFGKHASDTCSWISSGGPVENLTVTLQITVTNHKEIDTLGSYSLALTLTETGGNGSTTGYSLAKNANLVGALPTVTSPTTSTATTDSVTYEVPITFSWGSAFDNVNPMTKYKDVDYDESTANTVKGQLENLNAYLTGVGYKLTVVGTVTIDS